MSNPKPGTKTTLQSLDNPPLKPINLEREKEALNMDPVSHVNIPQNGAVPIAILVGRSLRISKRILDIGLGRQCIEQWSDRGSRRLPINRWELCCGCACEATYTYTLWRLLVRGKQPAGSVASGRRRCGIVGKA